jgi:hypothetical protein
MDPLSALAVAATVVDFVEFGTKLATTYFEVRSTIKGQPFEIVSLAASADDLFSVATTAQDKIKSLGSNYPRHTESLARLNAECTNVETKLKSALDKLTADPKSRLTYRGSKVLVAIRSVWSEKEYEEWRKQLDRIRN